MTQFQRKRIQEEIDRQARIAEPNTLFNRLKHSEELGGCLFVVVFVGTIIALCYLGN